MQRWLLVGLSIVVTSAACGDAEEESAPPAPRPNAAVSAAEAGPDRLAEEIAGAHTAILERADTVRRRMLGVRGLSTSERRDLRRDVNARQVAAAQSMGIRARSESQIDGLVRSGRLVTLEDSTAYWVLRDLTHSVPHVTPDTRRMLNEIGRRFHARLDSLGLPPYRMEVTSVLRTPATQANLRGSNRNAARGVSAHEYGTTLDVAHIRFSAPAASTLQASTPSDPDLTPAMRMVETVVLEEVGRKHAAALQAELGRVLRQMRSEGKLRVMMERTQAVYHMTVARRFPAGGGAD